MVDGVARLKVALGRHADAFRTNFPPLSVVRALNDEIGDARREVISGEPFLRHFALSAMSNDALIETLSRP